MTTAFAIKEPKGEIRIDTIRYQRKDCILDFIENTRFGTDTNKELWEEDKKIGWRCVKVQITEIKKEDK